MLKIYYSALSIRGFLHYRRRTLQSPASQEVTKQQQPQQQIIKVIPESHRILLSVEALVASKQESEIDVLRAI